MSIIFKRILFKRPYEQTCHKEKNKWYIPSIWH